MLKIFILLILPFIYSSLFALTEPTINLTQKEKDFIKNNPIITLGSGESFAPYIFARDDGLIAGYDVDITKLIEKKTGLKIQFELGKFAEIQERASKRELDGLSALSRNEQRDILYNYSSTYMKYTPIVIVNKGNPKEIHNQKDLAGKSVAVQTANAIFTNIAKSLENVEIVYYDTLYDLIKAVVSKEVDFTIIDETAFYLANEIGLEPFIEHSFVVGNTNDVVFCLRNDKPELASIFNKALKSIPKQQMLTIRDQWFGNHVGKYNTIVEFTTQEYDYLHKKKEITMCFDPDWMPFTKIENGKKVGMSADIYKLISKNMPIPIREIKTKNWSESLEFAQKRKCDILDLAIETTSRKEYLNFTSTFIEIPIIVVTRNDIPYINDIKEIGAKTIAIPINYAYIELLKKNYPNLNIIEVDTIGSGLQMVKDEKAFCYIGTLASVAHIFKENFTGELKISGKLEESLVMGSAVRSDDVLLLSIMQKLINKISQEEINNIINKWIKIKYEKSTDYTLVWKVFFISLLILLIVLFFYMRQRKLKDTLETIFNNSKDGVVILDMKANFLKVNPEFLIISDQNEESLLGSSLLDFSSKESQVVSKKALEDVLKKGYIKNLELEHVRENLDIVTVNISMSLLHHPPRILMNVRDVTEMIQTQKKLHEQEELMIVQSRHAAMGEMISMIAHQWRQPISVISMDANNILVDIELEDINPKTLKEETEDILIQTQELSKTIDDFRTFFHPNKEKDELFISVVCDEVVSVIGKSLDNSNVEYISDISENGKVRIFSRELLQVLLNIVNNAKEALIENRAEDRKITTTVAVNKEDIFISICDNAGGINNDLINKVFDPYFSTKKAKNGTGLGLYMSKSIIEKHFNGTLSVSNKKDGACFEIIFPYISCKERAKT